MEREMGAMRLKTASGYWYDEVISALQKMIRRGKEREAMHWAIELEAAYPTALWNRLEVIVNEDIGLANPGLTAYVHALREQYAWMRGRGNAGRRLCLANAILGMCRSPKSRLADEFVLAIYGSTERPPIPDEARDKHTRAGKALGRGFEHFFREGALLVNDAGLDNPYGPEAEANCLAGRALRDADVKPMRMGGGKGDGGKGQMTFLDGDAAYDAES